jgi:serine phosphatase RsbU (regulator of sigma subunit)
MILHWLSLRKNNTKKQIMKKYLLGFSLLISIIGYSQEKKYDFDLDPALGLLIKDSIEIINQLPESNDKAFLQYKLGGYYFFRNADSTIYYSKLVQNYTDKNSFKELQYYNHFKLGQVYMMMKSNYSLALYYLNLAKKEAEELNSYTGSFKEIVEGIIIQCYSGLGSYSKVKVKLVEMSKNALANSYDYKYLYTPVGMLGQMYAQIKEYDSSIKYSKQAIELNRTFPKEKKWGFPYFVIADAYVNKKEHQKALDYLYEGFVEIKNNNFDKDIAQTYNIFAQAHLGLNHLDSAIYYANQNYALSNKIAFIEGVLTSSELLAKIYDQKNQLDSAYKYLKLSNGIKDELSDKSKVNEAENITLNEELRQKQIQEDEANRKKLIFGFSLFFVIGFTGLIIYNRIKQKARLRQLEEDRKNKELQAARDLQISLLPKSTPKRNDLDIATFIRSSTEVGGDYYDFMSQENGNIYSICGDATGHGVTSGMMVSITKAGLNGIEAIAPNVILQKLNKVVKKVDLGTLRMSLNIVEISQNELNMSSAAMPPIYLYKSGANTVEELMQSGLPLGGLKNESFEQIKRNFESGDVLIQLSDGLPEAPNSKGEMYDYERLRALIQTSCHLTAKEIINVLMQSVDQWLEGKHNPDDITLIVTKKK